MVYNHIVDLVENSIEKKYYIENRDLELECKKIS